MWQPKQPASEVVAMRTFSGASVWAGSLTSGLRDVAALGFGADRLAVVEAFADRLGEADALDQDRADRADMRRLVGDREVAVAQLARWAN